MRRYGHVRWPGRSLAGRRKSLPRILVGDHALEAGLVGGVRNHSGVELVLPFARLGRKDMPGKRMLPDNLSRPGFLEPFGRTFVCLQFRHFRYSGKPAF